MNAIEKWASEQERAMAEVQMDIMKDSLQEISELLRHSKKSEKSLEGVGGGEKKDLYTITDSMRKGKKSRDIG